MEEHAETCLDNSVSTRRKKRSGKTSEAITFWLDPDVQSFMDAMTLDSDKGTASGRGLTLDLRQWRRIKQRAPMVWRELECGMGRLSLRGDLSGSLAELETQMKLLMGFALRLFPQEEQIRPTPRYAPEEVEGHPNMPLSSVDHSLGCVIFLYQAECMAPTSDSPLLDEALGSVREHLHYLAPLANLDGHHPRSCCTTQDQSSLRVTNLRPTQVDGLLCLYTHLTACLMGAVVGSPPVLDFTCRSLLRVWPRVNVLLRVDIDPGQLF